ncbi:UDP-N-acetylmuramate dehydrogenase [Thalassotalea sp. Y01]|uniref:UDP-N-acetylmuramate dehydrogenase n=1 Tax=Thalassotalea sp. Y01 TaxID=2729613 RepID=UPI001B7D559C|nr:UDP-N-acetylmuramate dehydrogenase [Thalassotalea sp. Y01]
MQTLTQSLKTLSTFAIESFGENVIHLQSLADVQALATNLPESFYILGGGSNTIFVEDYAGALICPELKGIEVTTTAEHFHLHVGSGENWHQLVEHCLVQGMYGLENLALIPGNCGAAPIQNIGAYGVELSDVCDYVDWYDFDKAEVVRMSVDACQFGYRNSIFKGALKGKGIITAIGLKLSKAWQAKIAYAGLKELGSEATAHQVFDAVVRIRQSKLPDPAQTPNTGSFFKNPVVDNNTYQRLQAQFKDIPAYPQADGSVKIAAGWLIDQCQLKGHQIGGAAVHVKQALVLINKDNAKGRDIIELAKYVQQMVVNKFAIQLQPEVRFIGQQGEMTLEQFV